MVKFMKNGKVVVLLTGRFAGRKAVIVKNYDEGTPQRPYGHAIVCGINKYPRKVKKRQSKKEQEKRARMKTFVKVVNYNHLMPTRYTMDADLKSIVTADVVDNEAKRTEAKKESKKVLEERFQTGKNRWFFTKLRF
uniref:60S ribosomal protein L27 n=1 Tax=Picocystis salinarum TaxID=88271 RepID=A0A7S3UBV3_9CHLO|mmetsp:Transcript_3926/g.24828  ORF Transcript_3926/g.24828 Transcript_3926/m.24828 type:complete len:136 (+) Transcript_3926:32-439(+)|eukprot:PRCOL_00002412-RA